MTLTITHPGTVADVDTLCPPIPPTPLPDVAHPTVWVVSSVYWNGTDQGGGGFLWQRSLTDALDVFTAEKAGWCCGPEAARVRLVEVHLPEPFCHDTSDGEAAEQITDWLDYHLDALEVDLPSIRVAIHAGS